MKNIGIYKQIFFSFLYRDEIFPSVIRSKGYSIKGALKTVGQVLVNEIGDFFFKKNTIPANKIWLYAETMNQFRAIEFLTDMDDTILVTNSRRLQRQLTEKNFHRIIYRKRLFFRLKWVFRRKSYKELFKEKFKDHFNSIFRNDGIYESLLKVFENSPANCIIMANDHNIVCRALLFAGKTAGIKSIYLQHAAVTDQFPPLLFDLSLLEGEDSRDKYLRAGPIEGKVELVGMPKFDPYFEKVNNRAGISTIGIALNSGDNYLEYFEMCQSIKKEFKKINFLFRFHPSIDIDDLELPAGTQFSDPKTESSFDFLSMIDVLFAGNSSIHLEATVMNVISIYIDFKDNVDKDNVEKDYYGFLSNNLVDRIPSDQIFEWLIAIKEKKPNVREKAKYYIDSVNTHWDGKSKEKVKKLIKSVI